MRVMKNQSFELVYIDAFAGTGSRSDAAEPSDEALLFAPEEQEERQRFHDGSAAIALQLERAFDHYWFLEDDAARFQELRCLRERFPALASRMIFEQGDANIILPRILEQHDWRRTRAVVFLDPYGANMAFDTMRAIAQVPALDVWILFPLGQAVNRLLTRNFAKMHPAWALRLDRVFGSGDWRKRFYSADTDQGQLFPVDPVETKVCDWSVIVEFYKERLRSVFVEVASETRLLTNSTNVPLFAFLFAMANPSEKARNAALKIANHILKHG
jgi:three-Cys-motif partner protein